jgi:hypothetical protein
MAADAARTAIDNPHALPLPPDSEHILRDMFGGYSRLAIVEELAGGFSGARVLVVHPVRADGLPELPAVVKFGPPVLIEQEWRAYQQHVQNRLPGVAAIQGPPHSPAGANCAGLRYPLVGSGTFAVETLQQFYQHAAGEQLRYVLEQRLFRQLGTLWRFSHPEPDFSLRDSYNYLLPVNLIIRPEAVPAGAPVQRLDETEPASHSLSPGDYVELHGFAVAEIEGDKGEITLNLLGPARSYRIRLKDGPALRESDVGSLVTGLTGRVITTRREILAVSALEIWGYTFDATAATFSLPGGRLLPNPLARLPAVLGASPTVKVAAIHGDLNPQNVLVDPETREVRLIDFADSRQDHVLHDLLRLETGIVTRLLPQSLQTAGVPPDVIIPLYEQLAAGPEGADARTAPALAKAAAMLTAVRREARAYLFDPDDWNEYWHGLTLYLLGTHKYANLDVTAKQLAFLGAATAQHLVAENVRRTPAAVTVEQPARVQSALAAEWPDWSGPHAPDVDVPEPSAQPGFPWWIPAGVVVVVALFLAILLSRTGPPDTQAPAPATTAVVVAPSTEIPVVLPSPTHRPATPTAHPSPTLPPTAAFAAAADCSLRGAGNSFVILLDLSQSMHGEKLDAAIAALQQLIACLDPTAEIAIYPFNDTVYPLPPAGPVAAVGEALRERLDLLFAGGNSALYDAVCTVVEATAVEDEDRVVTYILLADGPDTGSTVVPTETGLVACLPPGILLHTIAYGSEADAELLARLAGHGSGNALTAEPETLRELLLRITLQP